MKDGRTYLAHKAEYAVDLETGAIVAVTLQRADQGDTTTIQTTLPDAVYANRRRIQGRRHQGVDLRPLAIPSHRLAAMTGVM